MAIPPEEQATADDLLRDFAMSSDISSEILYRRSWENYAIMEEIIPLLADLFNTNPTAAIQSKAITLCHDILFQGLYSNSGRYRSPTDPSNGQVGFGGTGQGQTHKFQGTPPADIPRRIEEAVQHLMVQPATDPVEQAIRFYQAFVKVHPFYDGNGRIGRIITNAYLWNYGLRLEWAEFDSKGKFIQKLNYAHKSPEAKAMSILIDFCRDYCREL